VPLISRILFPVCSCFGPLFLVLGLQSPNRSPVNNALAFGGALLVTVALLLLYFALLRTPNRQA
jgi:protein-S-isoprenylcysteine O-methyltransferase Ste14